MKTRGHIKLAGTDGIEKIIPNMKLKVAAALALAVCTVGKTQAEGSESSVKKLLRQYEEKKRMDENRGRGGEFLPATSIKLLTTEKQP